MKVLLIEDEPELASFIKKGLKSQTFEVDVAFDGKIGKSLFERNTYDIAIVDVNIPYINGFELCKLFKGYEPKVPVLLLTALDSIDDKTEGFNSGADDYLVKPFEFQELILRISALTKRQQLNYNPYNDSIKIADLELNTHIKTVTRAGELIELTSKEFSLLEYLMRNQGKIVSRVEISEKVWDINFDTNTNIIDVYVNYLRNKVDKKFTPKLIHTVVGMGYVLRM
jgi:two-component system, OmpR family, copper resistance phosphate regulon response regulator CusR